jgi:hypothetical protein
MCSATAILLHNGLAYQLTDLHEIGILQSPPRLAEPHAGKAAT